jgi:hypothetical protein
MKTLTKKDLELIKNLIKTEIKMIGFKKGFNRGKTEFEIILEKLLKKLGVSNET